MVLRPRNGLSLCAGGGGLDLGLMLAEPGFHTRCFVEWEEYPRSALIAGQRAGYFAPAPIWDDLTTFDARPFAGSFDTLLAGYPCQPFSHAGQRRGADDERHLWPDVARVARELGPGLEWIFLENVAGHVTLGLETVLRELWDMGFTPAAGLFTAAETGAPHERERVFIVAHAGRAERRQGAGGGCISDRNDPGWEEAAGWVAEPSDPRNGNMGNTTGARCEPTRSGSGSQCKSGEPLSGARGGDMGHAARIGRDTWRSEHGVFGGWPASAIAGGAMADAAVPRHEDGGQPRQRAPSTEGETGLVAEPQRYSRDLADAERDAGHQGRCRSGGNQAPRGTRQTDRAGTSRPSIHPPGPADMERWRETLATSPHLAPATGLADCLAWARDMAAAVEVAEQAAAEPAFRRMADGLALRSRALRLLGNGVHPLAAANAWRSLAAAHGLRPVDLEADSTDRGAASTLAV